MPRQKEYVKKVRVVPKSLNADGNHKQNREATMKKLIILAALMTTGCAAMTGITRVYTSEERAYLDRAMATPQEIVVEKAKSEETWGRAQSFVGRFSDLKIQAATDYILETHNPVCGPYGCGGLCGFSATKTPAGDKVRISGHPICDPDSEKYKRIGALFRYYVATGEEPPEAVFTAPAESPEPRTPRRSSIAPGPM